MPQILKDEIRERILKSARDKLFSRGFRQATMKSIAAMQEFLPG